MWHQVGCASSSVMIARTKCALKATLPVDPLKKNNPIEICTLAGGRMGEEGAGADTGVLLAKRCGSWIEGFEMAVRAFLSTVLRLKAWRTFL